MEFNATFKNILNLLGVNNLVNRHISKHIEIRFFFSWVLTSWILIPQDVVGSLLIGQIKYIS